MQWSSTLIGVPTPPTNRMGKLNGNPPGAVKLRINAMVRPYTSVWAVFVAPVLLFIAVHRSRG